MAFQVRLTTQAEQDADKIYSYIFERAPQGANRWYRALLDVVDLLDTNPQGRPLSLERGVADADLRQMLFNTPKSHTYRALFIVLEDQNQVDIIAVRGPAQNLMTAEEVREALQDDRNPSD